LAKAMWIGLGRVAICRPTRPPAASTIRSAVAMIQTRGLWRACKEDPSG
jgi:hypothetical protein